MNQTDSSFAYSFVIFHQVPVGLNARLGLLNFLWVSFVVFFFNEILDHGPIPEGTWLLVGHKIQIQSSKNFV